MPSTIRAPVGRIRIGVSSCLLGKHVRYDGNHKRDDYVVDVLARRFECIAVCPEVAIGLGVPRPPIELVAGSKQVRAVGVQNHALDVTRPLRAFGRRMARALADISGYVLKSASPSCGIWDVKTRARRRSTTSGRGIFADEIMRRLPLLPVEDEVRLGEARRRDSFLERVFFYRRWQQLRAAKISRRKLLAFHGTHHLLLMAHGAARDRELQRLLARPRPSAESVHAYIERCLRILQRPATRASHARVLAHVAGELEHRLAANERAQLAAAISRYRRQRSPLIAPIKLLNRHLRRFPHPRLTNQIYLRPSRLEQRLRYEA